MTEPNPSTEPNDPLARQAGDDGPRTDLKDGEDRSFHTTTVDANRAVEQGNGVGQRELDAQADPNEGELSQAELDALADTSRDNHQTPRGNDAVRDTDDNLPG
jgi:hypothetical protein